MQADLDLYELGIMVTVISFLGFVLENIWLVLTKGYFDNRNMHLPFLFGYGVLVTGLFLLIGTPQNVVILGRVSLKKYGRLFYFLATMLVVSIGEIALGMLVERACGFEYWNYEWIPMHITKYTSLPTSTGFTAIIMGFMERVFPQLMESIAALDQGYMQGLSSVFILLMAVDFIVSFVQMSVRHSLNQIWKIPVGNDERRQEIRKALHIG